MNFWKFTRQYIVCYKRWYLLGIVCIFITQFCIAWIVDCSQKAIDAMNTKTAHEDTILVYASMIFFLACIIFVVRVSARLLFFIPGRNMEYHVRKDYFQNLIQFNRRFYREYESGDLVSRNSNDVVAIRAAYGYGFMQFSHVLITLVLGLFSLITINSEITMFLAIPIIFGFTLVQWHVRYIFQDLKRTNVQLAEISSFCLSSFRGISIVQAYHVEPYIQKKFEQINQQYFQTHLRIARVFAVIAPMVKLMGEVAIFLVIYFVGPCIIEKKMTLGQITAFLGYIAMIMPPMMSLGWTINMFQRALPSLERVMEVLNPSNLYINEKPHIENLSNVTPFFSLVANKLSFVYDAGKDSRRYKSFGLHDISFEIKKGKVLGIVGAVGSGKTTLFDTILRLNPVVPRMLYLNGQDVTEIAIENYRSYFSWANQQPFLFSTSLRENLNLAVPADQRTTKDWESVLLQSLKIVQFDLSPTIFPNGLDTLVGEKGVMLSGGQRARIALARCLLKNASVYLLDDILASVDFETENSILQSIRQWYKDKSLIMVAHRLSTIAWVDEILVLEDGKMLARGTHDFLVANCPYYRQVWEHQTIRGTQI